MLYTTYLSKVNKVRLPQGTRMIFVARRKPKNLDMVQFSQLAPSEALLNRYKFGMLSWNDFKEKFINEMDSETSQYAIYALRTLIQKGINICLVCYEKDYHYCHRKILAELIGEEWEEI